MPKGSKSDRQTLCFLTAPSPEATPIDGGSPPRLQFSSRIFVEPLAGFAAQAAGGHHFFKQRARAVFGVAESFVEDLHDVQADVEPDKAGEFERPHGLIHPDL